MGPTSPTHEPRLTHSSQVCSPLVDETEAPLAGFLARRDDFEIVRLPDHAEHEALAPFIAHSALLGGERTCIRTWTHRHSADSHFAAQLRRRRPEEHAEE